MASKTRTSYKRLLLNPRVASILEIFRVLSSTPAEIEKKYFIEAVEVKQSIIECKGIIFLSLLFQKLLQSNGKPLFGSVFESCLNVFGNKTNFRTFLNDLIFRGKVELPDQKSVRFLSTIGHLDNRVDLDKNIKPGSNKYFASLSAMASKIAYENEDFIQHTVEKAWKMDYLEVYDFWDERRQGNTTQAFMFRDKNVDPDTIVVAFRGTEPFNGNDWSTDVDISWYKLQGIKGRVHSGFMSALGLKLDGTWPRSTHPGEHQPAYNTIIEQLKCHFKNVNHQTKFIVTGHSLGGALAILFPAVLVLHNETEVLERLEAVYTFGQPKVGDEKFGKFMKGQFEHYGISYYRFVYNHDIVPRLPFDFSFLMYKHFGTCIYINSVYEAQVLEEEPARKNFITERVDAMWELVRSFLLPHVFGPEYKEGLLQLMFRMSGLLLPGLPDHGPQDYVNATRLAAY
ncbi:putative lipase [Handroanthus impetiginosus]|uniref:Putative lipase n=1 Tax=Handroanthus impetiginosus TaxID=429701 RepID=A0A2G9GZA2_9LAMI|nr:putative lipase [Handroanthus impetiginosus]